jgi:hypothetical protein
VTFGDTNGADEQHVGDVNGTGSVTGLGDLNETRFFTNGLELSSDAGIDRSRRRSDRRSATTTTSRASVCRPRPTATSRTSRSAAATPSTSRAAASTSAPAGRTWRAAIRASLMTRQRRRDRHRRHRAVVGRPRRHLRRLQRQVCLHRRRLGRYRLHDLGRRCRLQLQRVERERLLPQVPGRHRRLAGFDGKDSYGVGVAYDLGGGAVLAGGVAKVFGSDPYAFMATTGGWQRPARLRAGATTPWSPTSVSG